jgi:glycerol-3-phosphate dehydrogenase (NAD(P)+)
MSVMTDKANIYMNNPLNVCVLGGGSFGTALASIASANGYPTRIWMRNEQRVAEINEQHVNSQYLPGVNLHPALVATSSLAVALQDADVIFVSVPSKSFLEVMTEAKIHSRPDQCWVSTTKGIEESGFALMSDILRREVPDSAIGVLSGPNLAKEVAKKALAATVIASREAGLREKVQQVLGCSHFRVYANTDMYGVELGGALKNIYAIISGMAASLELGENTRAMLITRSLAEMSRFAVNLGANPMTFIGLAGVGDLIATCSSPLSRNYRVGFALAQG